MSIPEKLATKGFLETLLQTPKGPLLVFNIHFIVGGVVTKTSKKIKLAQINMLLERLKSVKISTIVAGDFNDEDKDEKDNFSRLLEKLGFKNSAVFLKKTQRISF